MSLRSTLVVTTAAVMSQLLLAGGSRAETPECFELGKDSGLVRQSWANDYLVSNVTVSMQPSVDIWSNKVVIGIWVPKSEGEAAGSARILVDGVQVARGAVRNRGVQITWTGSDRDEIEAALGTGTAAIFEVTRRNGKIATWTLDLGSFAMAVEAAKAATAKLADMKASGACVGSAEDDEDDEDDDDDDY